METRDGERTTGRLSDRDERRGTIIESYGRLVIEFLS